MKIEKIKPIPKYILSRIKKEDKKAYPIPSGKTRYYSYLATNDKELVKVTVAVKHNHKEWYYKQCAVHGVRSKECFAKDMMCSYLCGYQVGWHSEGLTKTPNWYEDNEWYGELADNLFDPFAPIVNKEHISRFPEYRYSAYEDYKGVDILQYLRLYEKYPQIEYLVKLGLSEYAKSVQILKKVRADKRFRKFLSLHRIELNKSRYPIPIVLRAYRDNRTLAETQARATLRKERDYAPIREMLNDNYERYLAYIGKQQITNRLYLDYLNACNYLGLDMNEDKNRYPHDFKHWHDVRIDEYNTAKAIEDEEKRKELYENFAHVADKYLPLQYNKKGEYVAIVAKSPAELTREGERLNHCVGRMNYDQKFIREESLIFFVRSREAPDDPLVTVEYSIAEKRILQCYAFGNTAPAEEIKEYINKVWLPYANRVLRKITA